MRQTLTFLALLAAVPAGAALAGDDCSVSRADWQPREAVRAPNPSFRRVVRR